METIMEAKEKIKEVEWALMNWETRPGPWESHIKDLIEILKKLLYI